MPPPGTGAIIAFGAVEQLVLAEEFATCDTAGSAVDFHKGIEGDIGLGRLSRSLAFRFEACMRCVDVVECFASSGGCTKCWCLGTSAWFVGKSHPGSAEDGW